MPPTVFFGMGDYLSFDGIVSMYHDQGLAPFKTLAGGSEFHRRFAIVGRRPITALPSALPEGEADATSMREAIYAAIAYSVVGRDFMRRLPTR